MIGGADATEQQALLQVAEVEIRKGWCQWEWVCGREREGRVEKLLALRESLRVRRGARLLARRRREAGQVGHARHQLDPPRAHAVHVPQELRLVLGHLRNWRSNRHDLPTVQRKNEHGGSDGVRVVFLFTYLKESPGRLRPPCGIGRLDTGDGAHEPVDPRQVLRLERHLEAQAAAPGGLHGLLDGARAARIAAAAEHVRGAPQADVELVVLLADEDGGVDGRRFLLPTKLLQPVVSRWRRGVPR